jgi:hypothetical protein
VKIYEKRGSLIDYTYFVKNVCDLYFILITKWSDAANKKLAGIKLGASNHKNSIDCDTQLFAVTITFNESKLTSNEYTHLIFVLKSAQNQFNEAKLLIQELMLANSELWLTNSYFR